MTNDYPKKEAPQELDSSEEVETAEYKDQVGHELVKEEEIEKRSEEREEAEKKNGDEISFASKKYMIAFLDDGHGLWDTPGKRTPYIPELGRSIRENEFNSAVIDIVASKLKPLGIIPILVAPTDKDTPLKTRTDFANRTLKSYQDRYGKSNVSGIYVSVHYDAMASTWNAAQGITIFVYIGDSRNQSGRLALNIAEYLRQGTHQTWRGIKEMNFHVLRETYMPAVLTENGFMSHVVESRLMLNKSFQNEVGTEHAKGIAKYFGVSYKETNAPKTPQIVGTPSTYTIKKGDTFYSIADRYDLSVDTLKKANPGVDPTNLKVGQVISLGNGRYTIKKGDTYYSIAEDFKISVEGIKKANPGLDPTNLQVGQVINVPTNTPSSPNPAPKPAPAPVRKISGIEIIGDIEIVNVKYAAYICDTPSVHSKNLATADKGAKLPIAGSVPGWWEVVYNGRRAYVNEDYGRRV